MARSNCGIDEAICVNDEHVPFGHVLWPNNAVSVPNCRFRIFNDVLE